MTISFSKNEYKKGNTQIIYEKIIADLYTPVMLYMKLCNNLKNTFLFESVEKENIKGRYSFIGLDPDIIFKSKGKKSYLHNIDTTSNSKKISEFTGNPINELKKLMDKYKFDVPHELPPMSSGFFGFFGYDNISNVEELNLKNTDVLHIPDSIFLHPTIIIVFDNITDTIYVTSTIIPNNKIEASEAHNIAKDKIEKIIKIIKEPLSISKAKKVTTNIDFKSSINKKEFQNIVKKGKDYIKKGDVFQVVLSQRFTSDFNYNSFSFYRSLRNTNPSPFLFYLKFDDFQIVGSSPEILIRSRNKKITVRPIAGTRKRGKNLREDNENAQDLLKDKKELAEHLMLLDLARNDVGKISKINTVKVTKSFEIEKYSHVMHISSNVEGDLKDDTNQLDTIFSAFPAGTVSGAPKIRAMEIIEELENLKRGPFYGCIGYLSPKGDVDTCITLRTALIKDKKIHIQAGAGIVIDSNPELEYEETLNKANALFKAAKNTIYFE